MGKLKCCFVHMYVCTILMIYYFKILVLQCKPKKKMKRKVISLETKIYISDRLRNSEKVIDVAKKCSMKLQ